MTSWRDLERTSKKAIVIGTVLLVVGTSIIWISDNNRTENIGFIILFFGGMFWSAAITIQVAIETTKR